MGEHEGWAQPSGLLPNGLLPNEAASVIQVLDSERWSKAEERTAELIASIQPNRPSEERRNAVADYVQRLIMKSFPCKVFTFGSVPLKTYLPDGDIDLTAFSKNQNLKDTWANEVRDMLQSEEKNENAEFHVKEVQYIQAEVKLIKCLVENIVVDISFNQLGGLCTLCFLEEVDHLINQNHLFKRSIILIKAWCYYESRILGAHHGLISTYALETLVLYIFHVFNNSFAGPLEVLYRFLEFFSKFDWDNFCVSLWGPVPISSLPDVTAKPPRKDSGELLLSKLFLDACSSVYADFPGGQDNQGQPFISKHFNVIDPLRINNNLGRSVSKGNFFRIRSAFAFGAKRLARLFDCAKEDFYSEVNQLFMNTWDRHGSGNRPDAPRTDSWHLTLSNTDQLHGPENLGNNLSAKKLNDSAVGETVVEVPIVCGAFSKRGNYFSELTSKNCDISTVSCNQRIWKTSSNQGVSIDRGQQCCQPVHLVNDVVQRRYLFARTRSSPELTDTYCDDSSHGKRNRAVEGGKDRNDSARLDTIRGNNVRSENLTSQGSRSSVDDPSFVTHTLSRQSVDASADPNSDSNFHDDLGAGAMSEESASVVGSNGMHQEEQDLVNMIASSMVNGFNGPVHMPLNFPFPLSPLILTSLSYAYRNMAGMVPANIPRVEHPWGTNMQFPQATASPMAHYFPGFRLASNPENLIEPDNENFVSVEMNPKEADNDFWHEHDRCARGLDLDNELQSNDNQVSTSAGFSPSRVGGSGNSMRFKQKPSKEARGSMGDDHMDAFQFQDNRRNEVYLDDRTASSRFASASCSSSMRNKTSSESSWDGSSVKVTKLTKEKRGRKTSPSAVLSTVYGKGKSASEHPSAQADEDNRDWNILTTGAEMVERSAGGPQSVSSLHEPRHQIPGVEPCQTSLSDSMIPNASMLLGPGTRQRVMDNSGVVPFTFYPTGPPVPFLTMLPLYNFPPETGISDASTSHFGGDEGLDNSDSGQNSESSHGIDQSEVSIYNSMMRASSVKLPEGHKSDILNSDFTSHWQNLQYGRFCQDPRIHGPLVCPLPVMVPPGYLQGRFPWDGPGRPLSANLNLFTQLMHGPRFVSLAPFQPVSNSPPNVFQRYVDEMPRYRSGTGTYLPNPKVSIRDRHSSGNRRGNHNYDRGEHHGDREGNWNIHPKTRGGRRNHSRSQPDKPSSRMESRAWRPDSFLPYQSQNGPMRSNLSSSQSGSTMMSYGMYPVNHPNGGGVSSNVPPVVMLHPFDNNSMNESRSSGVAYEERRFQRSSPDEPSSPHFHRRV